MSLGTVARLLNAALGIWLMAAPAVLGYTGTPAETNDRIVGPLLTTVAIVAISAVTRPLRRVNTMAGAWLLLAPLAFEYADVVLIVNSIVVGIAAIALSLVRGKVGDQFAGGWSSLFVRWELHHPEEAAE